jgi:hypothetical protein
MMEKSLNTAILNFNLFLFLSLGFILGLVGSDSSRLSAQHQIDPETWIEMRKMLQDKGPAPTIEEDVAALAGPKAKRAGPRLIDHGPAALPMVHAALGSTTVEPLHAQR